MPVPICTELARIWPAHTQGAVWEWQVDRAQLQAAYRLLQPFSIRRLKADVEKSLPPRVSPSRSPASGHDSMMPFLTACCNISQMRQACWILALPNHKQRMTENNEHARARHRFAILATLIPPLG